jgi:hypothetical protein
LLQIAAPQGDAHAQNPGAHVRGSSCLEFERPAGVVEKTAVVLRGAKLDENERIVRRHLSRVLRQGLRGGWIVADQATKRCEGHEAAGVVRLEGERFVGGFQRLGDERLVCAPRIEVVVCASPGE